MENNSTVPEIYPHDEYVKSMYELKSMLFHLSNEILKLEQQMQKNKRDIAYLRIYIRTIFSYIEGITFKVKNLSIASAKFHSIKLSVGEELYAQDKRYGLTESGRLIEMTQYIPLKSNIRYMFALASKATKSEYKLRYDKGWASLRDAIDIRNKLTHPKDISCLMVTRADIQKAQIAYRWFTNNVIIILKQVTSNVLATT